jgi:hypothetical protein
VLYCRRGPAFPLNALRLDAAPFGGVETSGASDLQRGG